jgi:hypothetical protein
LHYTQVRLYRADHAYLTYIMLQQQPSHLNGSHWTVVKVKVKVKVTLRLTVGPSVSLGVEPHVGLMTRYLLLFDRYGLVYVGRPLWREDGSVFCICCWPSPAQSFSGPSPLDLATTFYCLSFETSLFVASYDSPLNFLPDNSSARTMQKTQPLYCFTCVFTVPFHSNGSDADHIENIFVMLLRACMLRALHSNGNSLQSHCLATGFYITICMS